MRPYGKVNVVSALLLAAVAYGIWWLIAIGPAYLDNLDVKQAVDEAMSQAALGKGDEALKAHIIEKTRKVGEHEADDGYGTITLQEGLGLTPDNITVIRDEVHESIVIRVEYDRMRQLKPLSRQKIIHFVVEKEGVLER